MTDTLSKEQRSIVMSRIRSRDTKPEKIVRSLLHVMGYRFRLYRTDLPGKPDIVLPKFRTVIFVHGCFWHQHKGCDRASLPKSNKRYWTPKLKRNVGRFYEVRNEYKKMGWRVIVFWECETKNDGKLVKRLQLIQQQELIIR